MSLNTPEQQALNSIKDELARTDPQLAARLAMFSRLTSGEAMPARPDAPSARGTRRRYRLRWYRRLGLSRAAILTWLLISLSLIAIGVTLSHLGGASSCPTATSAACAVPASNPASASPSAVQAGP